ncbi:MAG: glycosyltransferase family 39 protein [Blastocatellia bacterium]|nr:glycosyltransferase family 39 protein [Blastocatellia bacterium]
MNQIPLVGKESLSPQSAVRSPGLSPQSAVLLLALALEGIYLSLYVFPGNTTWLFTKYILTTSLCFGLYLWAIHRIKKDPGPWTLNPALFFLLTGLLFRVTVLPLPPFTSDDIYRYLWDGRVQHAGINPYAFTPLAPELAPLRDNDIFPKVNHPEYPTVYPPVAQGMFFLAYGLAGNSFWGVKLLLLLSEAVTMVMLWRILVRLGKNPLWLIGYAWCPLPILEFFIAGHPDGFGLPWMALFLWWFYREQPGKAGFALGCAALVKFLPLILVPWLAWRLNLRQRLHFLTSLGLVVVGGYLPFLVWKPVANPFFSLDVYVQNWSFNAPTFWLLKELTGHGSSARRICFALLLLVIGWIALREREPMRAFQRTLLGFFFLTPTVYPWYLTWMGPFLALRQSSVAVWLLAASQISYVVMIDWLDRGVWQEPAWVLAVEYLPLVGLGCFYGLRHFQKDEPAAIHLQPDGQ